MLTLGGTLFGFLEAIGFAVEGDDLAVVDQAIDEGYDAGGVGEHLVPFGEGPVGGDDGALLLVAPIGQLEQQVGMAIGVGQVPDLIDLC